MNSTLNTSNRRTIKLLVNQLRDPGRLTWLFAAAVLFGGLGWATMYLGHGTEHLHKLLFLILLISPAYCSHWGLSLLHQRGRAEEYLMLPALLGEKLASRLLLTVVGLPLFWTLWTTLIGALGVVSGIGTIISSTLFNPFEFWGAWALVLYIAYSTSWVMFSVWYSSAVGFKAVLYTVSVIILLIAAPIISTAALAQHAPIAITIDPSIFFATVLQSDSLLIQSFMFSGILALAVFFVYLTYLRMREIEA